MALEQEIFQRSELLLGQEAMERIAQKRVIIFGVGGVGSWCAESLVRSGIKQLTIVDSDSVCQQYQSSTDGDNGDHWKGKGRRIA